jgi:hypothetical protein
MGVRLCGPLEIQQAKVKCPIYYNKEARCGWNRRLQVSEVMGPGLRPGPGPGRTMGPHLPSLYFLSAYFLKKRFALLLFNQVVPDQTGTFETFSRFLFFVILLEKLRKISLSVNHLLLVSVSGLMK